jgi:hypothetical protein
VRTPARAAIETFGTGGGNQSQTLSDGHRTIRFDRHATPATARHKIAAGIFSNNLTRMISPNPGKTSASSGAAQNLREAGRRAIAQGDTSNGKRLSAHCAELTENK